MYRKWVVFKVDFPSQVSPSLQDWSIFYLVMTQQIISQTRFTKVD